MKIISIEPTPSPNTMKLNLDIRLPDGIQYTFTQANKQNAPEYGQKLLSIPDVSSYFQTADFIALDRISKGSWQLILEKAREILGKSESINPIRLNHHQLQVKLHSQVKLLIPDLAKSRY